MADPPNLQGVEAKLGRAQIHLDAFKVEADAFLATNPYTTTREVGTEGREHRERLVVRGQAPDALGLTAGDCVHNLRSALDHLANALVVACDKTPTTRTEFPVFYTEEDFDKLSVKKVEGMSGEIIDVIRAVQPYQRGEEALAKQTPLWLVHHLDLIDKHRRLVTQAVVLPTTTWVIPNNDWDWLDVQKGMVENGEIVARVMLRKPYPQEQVQFKFTPDVTLEETPLGLPARDFLSLLIESTTRLIWAVAWVSPVFREFIESAHPLPPGYGGTAIEGIVAQI